MIDKRGIKKFASVDACATQSMVQARRYAQAISGELIARKKKASESLRWARDRLLGKPGCQRVLSSRSLANKEKRDGLTI